MKLAAAEAIASVILDEELGPEHVVPSVFNRGVVPAVAAAVARAAEVGGAVRRTPGSVAFKVPAVVVRLAFRHEREGPRRHDLERLHLTVLLRGPREGSVAAAPVRRGDRVAPL
jgi:hypothetical protein